MIKGFSAFSWIYSFLCSSLGFLTKRGFDLEGILTSCTIDYLSQDSISHLVLILMFIGGFFLPFSIIIVCYYLIISILKLKNNILQYNFSTYNQLDKFSKKSLNLSISENFRSCSSLSLNDNSHLVINKIEKPHHYSQMHEIFQINPKYHKHSCRSFVKKDLNKNFFFKRETRVSKTIITYVGFFCLTWFPYTIVLFLAQFCSNRERFITPLSASFPALFAKFSTVANPIIYTLHYKECMRFFLDVFHLRIFFSHFKKTKSKN